MRRLQASTWQEGNLFVALCLEIDIASQGANKEEALANLREALEGFFETASPAEIDRRLHKGVQIFPVGFSTG